MDCIFIIYYPSSLLYSSFHFEILEFISILQAVISIFTKVGSGITFLSFSLLGLILISSLSTLLTHLLSAFLNNSWPFLIRTLLFILIPFQLRWVFELLLLFTLHFHYDSISFKSSNIFRKCFYKFRNFITIPYFLLEALKLRNIAIKGSDSLLSLGSTDY